MSAHAAPALPPSPQSVNRPRRRPKGWGRRLSDRQVGKLLRIDQCWLDRADVLWRVAQIHRADHQAELVAVASGHPRQILAFTELGRDFRLLSEVWSR